MQPRKHTRTPGTQTRKFDEADTEFDEAESSYWKCSISKVLSKIFLCRSLFFNKATSLSPSAFLKTRL